MIDILFQHLKIKGVFRLFDKDEDGDIPAQELGTALRALGAYPSVRDRKLDAIQLYRCNINTMKIYNVQFAHIGLDNAIKDLPSQIQIFLRLQKFAVMA